MTNEQKEEIVNGIRKQIGEEFEIAEVACATLLDLIEEHPEFMNNIGEFLKKYWGTVFTPLIQVANMDAINARAEQYQALKNRFPNLSNDQLIKLITGC